MLKKILFLVLLLVNIRALSQMSSYYVGLTIPMDPNDKHITELIKKLGSDTIINNKPITDNNKLKIYRELGIAFWDNEQFESAEYYLLMSKGYKGASKEIIIEKVKEVKIESLSKEDSSIIKSDKEILNKIPQNFTSISKQNMEKVAKMIDNEIAKLIKQKDELLKKNASKEVIESKENSIKTLTKEKEIVTLHVQQETLKEEKEEYKKYLILASLGISVLVLILVVLIQKKTIKTQDKEIEEQLEEINQKNAYLEYAAKIIRHDMHSGINTYIPRGLLSLEKKLTLEDIKKLNLDTPLKMIKEGLKHTQKVYKVVYEFTNLVKKNVTLEKTVVDLKELIETNLENTSYATQVRVDDLIKLEVNEILFWNAIDNLIKNGVKYNDKISKDVHIYMEKGNLVIEDNGIGLTSEEFKKISHQFITKEKNISGLGINICFAILKEHGYTMECEKLNTGTKITIKLNKET